MPMYLLFRLMTLIGRRYCLQVESSCRHIWIDDSPVTHATVAPGLASCTPIAAGGGRARFAPAAGWVDVVDRRRRRGVPPGGGGGEARGPWGSALPAAM